MGEKPPSFPLPPSPRAARVREPHIFPRHLLCAQAVMGQGLPVVSRRRQGGFLVEVAL